jgi:hypothetical protein
VPIEGGPGLPGALGRSARWPDPPLPAAIVLDGRRIVLRAGSTPVLMRALARRNWMAFLPDLTRGKDQAYLNARLDDPEDPLDLLELSVAAQWAAAHVCQMPWWAAVRLAATAREGWEWIDGRAALGGADLMELPVHRTLSAIWAFFRDRHETAEGVESLTSAVFDSGMDELILANRIAPSALDALEAGWAAEAAAQFTAGADGVWDPTAAFA